MFFGFVYCSTGGGLPFASSAWPVGQAALASLSHHGYAGLAAPLMSVPSWSISYRYLPCQPVKSKSSGPSYGRMC